MIMEMSRREARKYERRACILEVARQSFFERGYAATTMSDIAATLGGSKGTLWSYFPSKQDLFSAVLEDATAKFKQELLEVLELHEDVHSTLARLCLQFVRKLSDPSAIQLHRLINGEGGRFPELGRIFFERLKAVKGLIADYLDQCVEEGSIRRVETSIAADHLMGLCMTGCHQKLLLNVIGLPTPEETAAEAAYAVDAFIRAYGRASVNSIDSSQMPDNLLLGKE